jgi:hypothetical protein
MDTIKIQILDDGSFKIETDKVSMPNHANAEAFLRECAKLAGGEITRKGKHGHTHAHSHEGSFHKH